MMTPRNATASELRPLTARSVLLSTLLGLDPPVLPAHRLAATARLFGIKEGTTRVALSRMQAAGEVVAEGGTYRLAGRHLERQERQRTGQRPPSGRWRGRWRVAVVSPGRRPPAARAELRRLLGGGRLAEWREGIWTRPDNLADPEVPPDLAPTVTWLSATPDTDPGTFAATLWDLERWRSDARQLVTQLADTRPALDRGQTEALAPGFVLSAAVLRHLAADPLLPPALLPPDWPGPDLRRVYADWDAAYRRVLADWHRSQR